MYENLIELLLYHVVYVTGLIGFTLHVAALVLNRRAKHKAEVPSIWWQLVPLYGTILFIRTVINLLEEEE